MQKRTRNKRITFRMTEEEFNEFCEKVKLSKLSQNEFMLKSISKKQVIVVEDLQEVYKELRRIGVNVNQIAKHVNTYENTNVEKEVIDIKNKIEIIVQETLKIAKKVK